MCGIVGLALCEPGEWARSAIAEMTDAITHRGPDSAGVLANSDERVWLGFRRLAIRDLDPRADQPMISASGRTAVVFNGEIYNTSELAAKHCGHVRLRTTGDTEVFLEAFERRGAAIFAEANGMFAAAFLTIASGEVTLVRDRLGKKPLFVHESRDGIAFGSELRTLRRFALEPDPHSLPFYLNFGYFPSPHTFFRNTSQVRPGEYVVVRDGAIQQRRRYFDITQWAWGQRDSVDEAALQNLLADAVSIRTLSDVRIGGFLSGGIDSALVAALLQATGRSDLPMFTVSFREGSANEAPFAAEIARQLDLSHQILPLDEQRLPGLIDDYLDCYEQPYADSSGLPSMLLCQAVKQHVTVALCGDGGDEFFGGYTRYDWFRKALRGQRVPAFARSLVRWALPLVDHQRGLRLQRLLETRDAAGLYAQLIGGSACYSVNELLVGVPAAREDAAEQLVRDTFARVPADPISQAACFDAAYYIPDDLQVKMDRASMRVALEVRCPLLDYRVAQIGAELATSTKFRDGQKTVLRDVLSRFVPRSLFERPKHGFSVPMRTWLSGSLRDLVHQAFRQRSVVECGWLDVATFQRLEGEYHAGRTELSATLWSLFVLARFVDRDAVQRRRSAANCPSLVTTNATRRQAA
jgi:asparagine synthase (glutamine-hydrolysing)